MPRKTSFRCRLESGPATADRRPLAVSTILQMGRFFAGDEIVATGVCDAAERCRPGEVFVARVTADGDGHGDAARAVARGAAGVVAERMLPAVGVPLCVVDDGGEALARLHHAFAGHPARGMRLIAITGTSGKTTTAWLAAAVLAEAGLRVGTLSDLGCVGPDDGVAEPADASSAAGFARWLAQLSAAGCTHAVVEVSSRMLAEHVLAGVTCDTVAVTNLATAHLDAHATRRAYHAIKARLVETLDRDGCLVSGCDPAGDATLQSRLPLTATLIRAGLAADCELRATPVEGSLFGRTVLCSWRDQVVPLSLDTPVVPFVRDSLLAAAIGVRYGVPLEVAVRGIESVGPAPGRGQRIDRGQETPLFVDAPTSRSALAATLASLRRLTRGRLAVIAAEPLVTRLGGDAFGPLVGRHCDACVVAPTSVLADDPADTDLAAYARIDRLLGSLGPDDCGIVLDASGGDDLPPGPPGRRSPLASLVEAWLQIAQTPVESPPRRAA